MRVFHVDSGKHLAQFCISCKIGNQMADHEILEDILRRQIRRLDDELAASKDYVEKLRRIQAAFAEVDPEFGAACAGAEDSAIIALIEFARNKARRVRQLEAELNRLKHNA